MDDQWNVSTGRETDGRLVLRFEGELDLNAAEELERVLTDAIDTADVVEVVIDLREVGFVDSSALSAFARARLAANERGVGCTFTQPQEHVRRVIDIAGLTDLLDR
jgi:anti-anti-sigma factor